ncbi:MAG: class I SAM-dependent methyltransferase [Gemmatimonadaceae bacterium]|nr:class I SAM-dependent methyltransferase [Gemmatimonadaceae bacterium]
MSIDDAYNRWAPTYDSDANRTRDLDADVMRQLFASLHVRRFIEAGCGTGKNSEFFAAHAEELVALDFSREMLAKARARTGATNVAFVLHDLHAPWPVEHGVADVVSFNLVLEHVRDLAPVLAHAAAACRDGGEVLLTELHPARQYLGGQAHFQAADGDEVRVPAYLHHLSDYITAAESSGLRLARLHEWWHANDVGKPPRLVTLRFLKGALSA